MRDVTKLDITKIDSRGKYVDLDVPEMFRLSAEEILRLREYHNNPNIARNFDFGPKQEVEYKPKVEYKPEVEYKTEEKTTSTDNNYSDQHSIEKQPSPENQPAKKNPPKFKLGNDRNKFNNGKHKTKKTPVVKYGKRLIVGGLVIVIAVGIFMGIYENFSPEYPQTVATDSIKPPVYSGGVVGNGIGEETLDGLLGEDKPSPTPTENPIDNEMSYRRELIKRFSDIYQVDSEVVYNRIAELTDNFSSEDYLANYHIKGVTCKQKEVYASSEEEILLYAVRCIKQLPNKMGVSEEGLYINNGYDSGTDYLSQISESARITGVDRCLVYAIVRTECGFNSAIFNNHNNPAGIKDSKGNWWHFDTKEEGFIELCAEIIKYYGRIDKPTDDLEYDTIAQIRDIHAPLSDGNDYWLKNVWSILNQAKANEAELFGDMNPNDSLKR